MRALVGCAEAAEDGWRSALRRAILAGMANMDRAATAREAALLRRMRPAESGGLVGAVTVSLLMHASALGVAWQYYTAPESLAFPHVVMVEFGAEGGPEPGPPQQPRDVERRLAQLEAAETTLREELETVTAGRTALAEQLEAERDRAVELEREVESARLRRLLETGRRAKLEAELDAERERAAALGRQLEATRLLESLAAETVEAQAEQVTELEARDAVARQELQRATSEKQALEATLEVERERAREVERRLLATRILQTLEAERVNEQAEELVALETTQGELEQELQGLERRRAELRNQLAAERQRVTELQAELQQALEAKRAEVSGVTATYERLVEALEQEIAAKDIALHQASERLTVTIVDRILFPSGQATLTPEGRALIDKVGAVLEGVSDRRILIEGHTDDVPIGPDLWHRYPSNWELSTARATEVVKYLIRKARVARDRLSVAGRADTNPVASNETEVGRQQNRRIEIILLPPDVLPPDVPATASDAESGRS